MAKFEEGKKRARSCAMAEKNQEHKRSYKEFRSTVASAPAPSSLEISRLFAARRFTLHIVVRRGSGAAESSKFLIVFFHFAGKTAGESE